MAFSSDPLLFEKILNHPEYSHLSEEKKAYILRFPKFFSLEVPGNNDPKFKAIIKITGVSPEVETHRIEFLNLGQPAIQVLKNKRSILYADVSEEYKYLARRAADLPLEDKELLAKLGEILISKTNYKKQAMNLVSKMKKRDKSFFGKEMTRFETIIKLFREIDRINDKIEIHSKLKGI